MNFQNNQSAMNQQIFKSGLSVETISAYLLCCGLADVGKPLSTENILELWNLTEDVLMKSLKELEQKHILMKINADSNENHLYQLTEANEWR